MVRDHESVDVLVEIADRTLNAARNAGIARADGDRIAIVDHTQVIEEGWAEAVDGALATSDVVTGPTRGYESGETYPERPESRRIKGREVNYFNPGNVAFRRDVLAELDGFDEYLPIGGARDLAHRLAGKDFSVTWRPDMQVRRDVGADGGVPDVEWGWKYRSLSYRLTKNYGLRPGVVRRVFGMAGRDAVASLRDVAGGEDPPSGWLATGREVVVGLSRGTSAGVWARMLDRTPRRNPNGRSSRSDRAVALYDRRES
jgi:hypothetical protein